MGTILEAAHDYMDGVISGNVVVGELVRLAVERQIRDLRELPKKGYRFDETEAERPVRFIESFCRHAKGEWANKPLLLEPWQKWLLTTIFGWQRADDTRRFRLVFVLVARKNAKSTLSTGVGLYTLVADREYGAEIYSAATTRDQAKIVFDDACQMVRVSPKLTEIVTTVKNNLSVAKTYSKFQPLSSDYNSLDGLNVHCAIIDELHAHKDRGLFDVVDTATGARRQPLVWCITTAGVAWPDSICIELQSYGEKVLKGVVEDETYFPAIYTIDKDDDWKDSKVWVKANPNLGVSVKMDDLERKFKRALETPSSQNNFKTKHLDVWTNQVASWIPVETWDDCEAHYLPSDLEGRRCYAGLDLANTTDVAALSLVFPMDDETYRILQYYWVPRDNAELRTRRDQVNYMPWVQGGYVEGTPGNVIDYDTIRKRVNDLHTRYNIVELAIDRWNATQLATQLQGDGLTVVMFGQGFASMSGPMKELEALILSRRIQHNGCPVTRWMMGNVSAKTDAAGNVKPDKATSAEKIDGVVALIMAVGRAMVSVDPTSMYETEELFVF